MTKMNRKSDDSEIPVKRPNKGLTKERTAEALEGRKLAKRKKMYHNMGWTQSWETVQSMLPLLHRKAKEDKQQRFSSLMHHIWNPVTWPT
jgi:RNA-directed DNA polymerase